MSKTYTAKVTRDEDAWSIKVPEVDRVTQALNLRQVDAMARDLIAIMDGIDPAEIELRIEWPADITASLAEVRAAKEAAKKAAELAARTAAAAALSLSLAGATVRDIGEVMGLSFQRAQQLLDDARRAQQQPEARQTA